MSSNATHANVSSIGIDSNMAQGNAVEQNKARLYAVTKVLAEFKSEVEANDHPPTKQKYLNIISNLEKQLKSLKKRIDGPMSRLYSATSTATQLALVEMETQNSKSEHTSATEISAHINNVNQAKRDYNNESNSNRDSHSEIDFALRTSASIDLSRGGSYYDTQPVIASNAWSPNDRVIAHDMHSAADRNTNFSDMESRFTSKSTDAVRASRSLRMKISQKSLKLPFSLNPFTSRTDPSLSSMPTKFSQDFLGSEPQASSSTSRYANRATPAASQPMGYGYQDSGHTNVAYVDRPIIPREIGHSLHLENHDRMLLEEAEKKRQQEEEAAKEEARAKERAEAENRQARRAARRAQKQRAETK